MKSFSTFLKEASLNDTDKAIVQALNDIRDDDMRINPRGAPSTITTRVLADKAKLPLSKVAASIKKMDKMKVTSSIVTRMKTQGGRGSETRTVSTTQRIIRLLPKAKL